MIRVRELLEFIQRNPSLVEYDAPIAIILQRGEEEGDDAEGNVKQLCLGTNGARLTLEVLVD